MVQSRENINVIIKDYYLPSIFLDTFGECEDINSSSSLAGTDILRSPKNIRRTMDLLYQALGKAKISVSRRISYLNEADPMSVMVENLITFLP